MINSHILSQGFEYVEPHTVEEALDMMTFYKGKAKVMAGGTDLLVQMKMGRAHPEAVINLSRIPALRYMIVEKGLRIGPLSTFRQIEKEELIQKCYTALHEAARAVSSIQIKTMGTLGGNLCHGSPAADSAPPLIAFGARIKMIGRNQERVIPLETFFVGPGKTLLSAEGLVVEIQVPGVRENTGSAFVKIGRVTADLSKVSVAIVMEREGEQCRDVRIVLGAVAPVPFRAAKAEAVIRGKKISDSVTHRVALQVSEEIQPIDDIRSTANYRREASKALVREALELAWQRTGA